MSFSPKFKLNARKRTNYPHRITAYQVIILLIFAVFAARIYQIQFIQRQEFVDQAAENRFTTISSPATRGIVTDRNGVPLVVNTASANVTVTPALLPSDAAAELEVLERLANLIGIPLTGEPTSLDERGIPQRSLLVMVREGQGIAPFRAVVVKTDVDHDIARLLIADPESFPGVNVEWLSVRDYPTGALTAHVVGYMGPIPESLADQYEADGYVLDRDRIGYDGIEFSLDPILAGNPGLTTVERDIAGEIIRTVGESRSAQPGYNIQLTIDVELQQITQNVVVETLDNMRRLYPDDPIGYERGVAIAMNPRTGEILALVSWPTYDNSRFARRIDYPYYLQVSQDPKKPLVNQAVNSLYPPGSIFKMVTSTAILEEGIVPWEYEVFDPGQIELENRYAPNDPGQSQTFVCWLDEGHGFVNLVQAIGWSCDVYFYKVGGGYEEEVPGIGLGITRLGKWMELFGLGPQRTGIELAADQFIENIAVIPDPDWKRRVWGESWSTGDTYNSVFGQGYVLTTPLQMLQVNSAIANNGTMMTPTLVREVRDADGRVVQGFQPQIERVIPASEETIRLLQEGMRFAVTDEEGTAVFIQDDWIPGVPIAAKTGTAEFCDNIAAALERCFPGNWPAHAWFMAYAPYGNPEISVIVFIYNGREGSTVAGPPAASILNGYFQLKAERALRSLTDVTPTTP
jgi:penicillin-binding protein 2